MCYLDIRISCQCLQRADLIRNHVFEIVGTHVDATPSKSPDVIEAWMCADRNTLALCVGNNLAHGQRITGVEAAGDVRRPDNLKYVGIVANLVGSETFGHIGVEVDFFRHHRALSRSRMSHLRGGIDCPFYDTQKEEEIAV